jgi:hypothetical protein
VGKTIGISRFGSGSHLMSFVLADEKGWIGDKDKLFKFSVQHNFAQLRSSVQSGKIYLFLYFLFFFFLIFDFFFNL